MEISPLTRLIDVPTDYPLNVDYGVKAVTIRRLSPNRMEKSQWAFFDTINTSMMKKLGEIRQLQEVDKETDKDIVEAINALPAEDRTQVMSEWLAKKTTDKDEEKDDEKPASEKDPKDRTDDEVVQGMSKEQLIKFGVVNVSDGVKTSKPQSMEDFINCFDVEELTWLAANVVRWTDKQYREPVEGNESDTSSQAVS